MPTLLHAPQNAQACKSVAQATAGKRSVIEPKLDGWRVIVSNDDGTIRCWTRSGTEITGKMPAIEAAVEHVPIGTALDGEVVAFVRSRSGLVHEWGKVQSVLGSDLPRAVARSGVLSYVVFDVMEWAGYDCRALTYADRRSFLEEVFETIGEPVMLIPQVPATEEAYETLLAQGYEGGVVKWLDAPYAAGQRGRGWFKLKATSTVDAVVMGYKEGEGSFSGLIGAIEFGQHDESGALVNRGRCSGMDMMTRYAISADRDGFLGHVFEVQHMGVMPPHDGKPYGALRHPQFKRWRPDRDAASVFIHNE